MIGRLAFPLVRFPRGGQVVDHVLDMSLLSPRRDPIMKPESSILRKISLVPFGLRANITGTTVGDCLPSL